MRLKTLAVILIMCLILPSVSAGENISIEDIGTEPKELIDGTHAWFFANLSNNGDDQVEVVLDFWLDSEMVSRQNVMLEPKTYQKQIKSDNSVGVSIKNKVIEVIVYMNDTKVDNKSAQITVNKIEIPTEKGQNNSVLWYLLFACAIILGIYLFIRNTRTMKKEKSDIEKTENSFQENIKQAIPAEHRDSLLNNSAFFFKDLKNQLEVSRRGEEYKLLIDIVENINNLIQNIEINNSDRVIWNLENIKVGSNNLLSIYNKEQVKTGPILPENIEISQPVNIEKTETLDKTEIKVELEKIRTKFNQKKQFVDMLIPEFLLKIAEEKMLDGDIKASKSLILGAETILENDEVLQRLRKLREIGF
jgi:hypothetical protein